MRVLRKFTSFDSPVGELLLSADDGGLRTLEFAAGRHPVAPRPEWTRADAAFEDLHRQLNEYFAGRRTGFDVRLAPEGSPFQLRAWEELRQIPYGATISYGELARRVGNPAASRAVGLANGRNPISIIIPCHRVIGATGKLTGFGGGLENKRRLLALEQRQLTLL